MNVYDLEKKATPAPWVVLPGSNQKEIGTLGEGTVLVSKHHPPWEDCEPRCIANSALAAHCRNNFMKALEALKHQVDPRWTTHGDECASRGPAPYDARRASDEGCDCWVKSQRELIEELEEVKP
jgi:hypothetical protein